MMKVVGLQETLAELDKVLGQIRDDQYVTVGIHEAAGDVESGEINMATLGAVLNFGAEIDHPGGTSYGYATEEAESRKEVRFLKTGTGFKPLGVTKPHKINIPARPWLEPGVQSKSNEYVTIIERGASRDESTTSILEKVGVTAQAAVRMFMTELQDPPNAKSTIRKKGSSNPLIDTGALRQSVTYVVHSGKLPDEGL
ncbi:tail completion or Neck1 protein [Edwardsiella phage PEi21]|uniref:Neck protein n=1 Tax=Edwardsiella phage PEi21 TaxID=1325372 RepID=N0DSB8_9CAUD|nr:tail completion or Neck1 protein [Edwardsiella phage PEi21]BAN16833.1 hypothetical protein [Edwardsiella phage PEi21]